MCTCPDSPEGVAFALLMQIAGHKTAKWKMSEEEVLALYGRCLEAARGRGPVPYCEGAPPLH